MAGKIQWRRGAWWVVTHDRGKRSERRVGPTDADKRMAEATIDRINHRLKARKLGLPSDAPKPSEPLPTAAALRNWHQTYTPTFSRSFERESLAHQLEILRRELLVFFLQEQCSPANGLEVLFHFELHI